VSFAHLKKTRHRDPSEILLTKCNLNVRFDAEPPEFDDQIVILTGIPPTLTRDDNPIELSLDGNATISIVMGHISYEQSRVTSSQASFDPLPSSDSCVACLLLILTE